MTGGGLATRCGWDSRGPGRSEEKQSEEGEVDGEAEEAEETTRRLRLHRDTGDAGDVICTDPGPGGPGGVISPAYARDRVIRAVKLFQENKEEKSAL